MMLENNGGLKISNLSGILSVMGKQRKNKPGYKKTLGKDGQIVWSPVNISRRRATKKGEFKRTTSSLEYDFERIVEDTDMYHLKQPQGAYEAWDNLQKACEDGEASLNDVYWAAERLAQRRNNNKLFRAIANYLNVKPVFDSDEQALAWRILVEADGAALVKGDLPYDFDARGGQCYGVFMMGSILGGDPVIDLDDNFIDSSTIGESAIKNGYVPSKEIASQVESDFEDHIEECVYPFRREDTTPEEFNKVRKEAIVGLAFLVENNILALKE